MEINVKCSQCCLGFIESPTLYQKRIRINGPKTCRECNRIGLGEERKKKRKHFDKKPQKTQCKSQLEALNKVHGKVSIPLLMNKLRISFLQAKELAENIK